MSGTRIPRGLFVAIVLASIAQCVHDFPLLPDRLASHFAASGMPNGWMSKQQFFIIYAVVLVPALVIEFWVSHRIANKPNAKLNLPNKEYWLAPSAAPKRLRISIASLPGMDALSCSSKCSRWDWPYGRISILRPSFRAAQSFPCWQDSFSSTS